MTYKQWCAIAPRTDRQKRAYRIKIVTERSGNKHGYIAVFGLFVLYAFPDGAFISNCVFKFAICASLGSDVRRRV